jgi:hypothetical protein
MTFPPGELADRLYDCEEHRQAASQEAQEKLVHLCPQELAEAKRA